MIRDATAADAEHIAALYNPFIKTSLATFEEVEVSPSEMERRLSAIQSAGLPYLVHVVDGVLHGYAYASVWKARAAYRHTVEVSVYVDPKSHGIGIGRTLYTELFDRLRKLDYHAVMGVITLPNAASVKLHENFGLKKVAHFSEVGRKFGRWVDVGYWQGFLD